MVEAWAELHKDELLKNCSKGGKIGGGKAFKRVWKDNREHMIECCRKSGKLGGKASIQKQQKSKPSYIELTVRKYLDELKIKYKPNVWFPYNGSYKEADIVIPVLKLIIECDGWPHRTMKKVKQNDRVKNKLFNSLGYKVLRLTGTEIRDGSFVAKLSKEIEEIRKNRVLLRR